MTPSRVTVIIPSWNGLGLLTACLEAAMPQLAEGDQVIVVDNGSHDDTPRLLPQAFPGVRLIALERNHGVPAAWNIGAEAAPDGVLVFLNQDLVLLPGALDALRRAALAPDIGVVGCKILYFDRVRIYHAGGVLAWPLGRGYHPGYGEPDAPALQQPRDCDYVTGAAFAVRRALVQALGGFDTQFSPGYYEDVDFNLRVRAAGLRAHYLPTAVALHHESTSLGRESERLYRVLHTNRLRLVLKHYQAAGVAWADFLSAEEGLLADPWNANMAAAMQWIYRGAEVARLTPAALAAIVAARSPELW